jgi:hypothetical protein
VPRSFLLTQEIDNNVNYGAAFVKDDSDEFNEPYLPARYKETVRKKKQGRLLKKIGLIAVAVIAVVVVYILLSGALTGSPQPSPATTPGATPLQTMDTAGIPTATPVKTTFPTSGVTAKPTTVTAAAPTETPEPVLTAMAGAFRTVTPSTAPKITEQQAKTIALAAFPRLPAGDMQVELSTSPDFGLVWKYTLRADTTTEASGLLDAESGSILTFNRTIHPGARSRNPVLTLENARQTADSTINSRNTGILSVNMSDGSYIPLVTQSGNVAGSYRFVYNRIVQDYPCDADGFIVSVDAVTGEITEYVQHWQTPENAFMLAEDTIVPKYDATYTVMARAKKIYPSVQGLIIISADIRWKDRHDPAIIPRPATIPLAWKVIFDDDTIRSHPDLAPGTAWVDTHTGDLIDMSYRH